ncbi:MAG: spermidine synthase [Bryobacterales bacterium]|nr:spermidine synthase [Bryobacterales bacterium]
MPLYALTIFLSAFLLFQVQPLIAKTILAWFGGTAAVWTTCMLFFQFLLLAGYLYAHFVIHRLRPRQQAWLHGSLLAAAVLLLPVIPNPAWKPSGLENPTWRILLLLGATVGLPYLLCSTTGPLLQAWYARTHPQGGTPYRLFALSNFGSMLALVSYPFAVEPYLPGRTQAWLWSAGFALFAALCAYAGFRASGAGEEEQEPASDPAEEPAAAPGFWLHVFWIGLAAGPSMLMLAVTNHLTQDVASMPFLWIVPLSIYLLSFILTFDARGWYQRELFLVLVAPALGGLGYLQWSEAKDLRVPLEIAAFSAGLFIVCMVCHGELAQRKPAPRHLTSFFLMLSAGGALGGIFVGLVAPYLFIAYFELAVAIGFCGLMACLAAIDESGQPFGKGVVSPAGIALLMGLTGLCIFLGRTMNDSVKGYRVVQRNFYGGLRVREADAGAWEGYRTLLHGSINHGEQWTHPSRRRELLSYYCDEAGIGRVMRLRRPGVPHRVGVLGLGAGTMAAFGRAGDSYRFYEINPAVPLLARAEFTFVPDSPAQKEVVMGDGRLSLERETPQGFDVLMMDAFSGDSIPVHLVTREAFIQYYRHLKPGGVIVIHISNKYLDLEPVLARIAESLHKPAIVVESDDSGDCFGTTYVLFAHDPSVFERPEFSGSARPAKTNRKVGIWTDDYSNLFHILK